MKFPFLQIVLILLPVIAVASIYKLIQYIKQYNLIFKTKTSKISFLKPGYHEIKGEISPIENPLTSPLSEKPCVYYNYVVEQRVSTGKRSKWVKIIEDEQFVDFEIYDSSGAAKIDLKNSDFNLRIDKKEESGYHKNASPQMKKSLEKYGKTNQGFIFEKPLKYKEIFLETGDDLYVLGETNEFVDYKPVFKQVHKPMIISDKSEKEILEEIKARIIVSSGLIVASLVVEIILMVNTF